MTIFYWVSGVILISIGMFFSVMNWSTVLQWLIYRRHSSWIPLFGGGLLAIGFAIIPFSPLNPVWWAPLMLDWGCTPGLLITLFFHLNRIRTRKSD